MDVVRATVADIAGRLAEPPTATAVRTMLHILEQKGYLRHDQDGLRKVYMPAVPAKQPTRSVLRGRDALPRSRSAAMATLLELPTPLSEEELDRGER